MPHTWRRTWLLGFVVLLGLALVSCGGPTSTLPPPHGNAATFKTETNPDDVLRVTPQDLYARLVAGEDIVIVDARGDAAYAEEHISGALSIPLARIETHFQELPRDRDVAFYCT